LIVQKRPTLDIAPLGRSLPPTQVYVVSRIIPDDGFSAGTWEDGGGAIESIGPNEREEVLHYLIPHYLVKKKVKPEFLKL